SGRLKLKSGGRFKKLLSIFASPVQPGLDDYYEPWTYDYENLIRAPLADDFPVARPQSAVTGEDMSITASANWDDSLGGINETIDEDPIVAKLREESNIKITAEYEKSCMFFVPRLCEHYRNPSCAAACPSGAL